MVKLGNSPPISIYIIVDLPINGRNLEEKEIYALHVLIVKTFKISHGRESMADRPLGIAIMAILGIIAGILVLLGSLAAIGISAFLGLAFLTDPGGLPIPVAVITALGTLLGVVLLIVAIIILVVSRGIWIGSNWARVLMLILLVLGAISSAWTLWGLYEAAAVLVEYASPVVSLLIELFFIYYLTRSHVVDFFT